MKDAIGVIWLVGAMFTFGYMTPSTSDSEIVAKSFIAAVAWPLHWGVVYRVKSEVNQPPVEK